MSNDKVQTFSNHTRKVPVFGFGLLILLVTFVRTIVELRHGISFGNIMNILVTAALIALFVSGRNSTLAVQDRVIRLEMRLRLSNLLPSDLQPRIADFTLDQLIALRFAGDTQLPALARKVLDEKINDRKAIKQLVTVWQADYLRA